MLSALHIGLWSVYGLGCLLCLRRIMWEEASDSRYGGRIDGEDLINGFLLGIMTCWFWPIILVALGVKKLYNNVDNDLVGTLLKPRHVRKREANERKRDELEEREREVRLMEIELQDSLKKHGLVA